MLGDTLFQPIKCNSSMTPLLFCFANPCIFMRKAPVLVNKKDFFTEGHSVLKMIVCSGCSFSKSCFVVVSLSGHSETFQSLLRAESSF